MTQPSSIPMPRAYWLNMARLQLRLIRSSRLAGGKDATRYGALCLARVARFRMLASTATF